MTTGYQLEIRIMDNRRLRENFRRTKLSISNKVFDQQITIVDDGQEVRRSNRRQDRMLEWDKEYISRKDIEVIHVWLHPNAEVVPDLSLCEVAERASQLIF
jgi:hypothetical protein